MTKVVAPGVGMHGKKVSVIKAEAGNGIVAVRKSPIWENRVGRKIRTARRMGLVPAGRMRCSRCRPQARAHLWRTANHRPRGNRTASRRCVSHSHGRGGNESVRAGHRSAAMLLRLPDDWEYRKNKES